MKTKSKKTVRRVGLGEWINTYNAGTKRGWGVWPTRDAAIKSLSVYPIPPGDTYTSTIPRCEWCA